MTRKFDISCLSSIDAPMTSEDLFIVEAGSRVYKATFEDIAKDILSNRLKFKIERKNKKGQNKLSVMFQDDSSVSSVLTSITVQDGILSSAQFDEASNTIILKFNTMDPSEPDISVSLSSLVDVYDAGYGLALSDDDHTFYVDPAQLTDTLVDMTSDQEIQGAKTFIEGVRFNLTDQISSVSHDADQLSTAAEDEAKVPTSYAVNQLVDARIQDLEAKIQYLSSIIDQLSS